MNILLFGDSITGYIPKDVLGFNWSYNFNKVDKNPREENYFVCGTENYTTDMLREYVYPHIDSSGYDTIILQCGVNDFLRPRYDEDCKSKTPEEIATAIQEFVAVIKESSSAEVMLQSLYPIGKDYEAVIPNISRNIRFINEELFQYCSDNGIFFIDMYSDLADEEGFLAENYSDDGLHPNKEGYRIVVDKIKDSVSFSTPLFDYSGFEELNNGL